MLSHNPIMHSFDCAADVYSDHAQVQKLCAEELIQQLALKKELVPRGPILEIGCGTGFATLPLVQLFTDREALITDISPRMLLQAKKWIEKTPPFHPKCTFQVLDGESVQKKEAFALIASSMVFQWFVHLEQSLLRLKKCLVPGGVLCFAIPLAGSFPEWREACQAAATPYTGKPLPAQEEICRILSPASLEVSIKNYKMEYPSPLHFFLEMKQIGAGVSGSSRPIPPGQMRRLLQAFSQENEKVNITYRIGFFIFTNTQSL